MMPSNALSQHASTAPGPTSACELAAAAGAHQNAFDIVDFCQEDLRIDFPADIRAGLDAPEGQKTLPTLLVYDEPGLQLFEDITFLHEYYLTNAEISILEQNATRLAEEIEPHSIILELGSGYACITWR